MSLASSSNTNSSRVTQSSARSSGESSESKSELDSVESDTQTKLSRDFKFQRSGSHSSNTHEQMFDVDQLREDNQEEVRSFPSGSDCGAGLTLQNIQVHNSLEKPVRETRKSGKIAVSVHRQPKPLRSSFKQGRARFDTFDSIAFSDLGDIGENSEELTPHGDASFARHRTNSDHHSPRGTKNRSVSFEVSFNVGITHQIQRARNRLRTDSTLSSNDDDDQQSVEDESKIQQRVRSYTFSSEAPSLVFSDEGDDDDQEDDDTSAAGVPHRGRSYTYSSEAPSLVFSDDGHEDSETESIDKSKSRSMSSEDTSVSPSVSRVSQVKRSGAVGRISATRSPLNGVGRKSFERRTRTVSIEQINENYKQRVVEAVDTNEHGEVLVSLDELPTGDSPVPMSNAAQIVSIPPPIDISPIETPSVDQHRVRAYTYSSDLGSVILSDSDSVSSAENTPSGMTVSGLENRSSSSSSGSSGDDDDNVDSI
eukprot:gene34839-42963_t